MAIKTRKPTAKPSWPVLLLAGAPKSGKSYSCALASASELVDGAYWVSFGETSPDQYGALPGADFGIIDNEHHGGTIGGLVNVLTEIASEKQGAKPKLLVVDSMTTVWDAIKSNLQATANQRAARRASKYNKVAPEGDQQITMDLWNQGRGWWRHIVQAINAYQGPVVLTARLDNVAEVRDGKPTGGREEKIRAEKDLPYDVDAIVNMPERGKAILWGLRSVVAPLSGATEMSNFTVEGLWKTIGLDQITDRSVSEPAEPAALDGEDES